jgi:hypothetical protein
MVAEGLIDAVVVGVQEVGGDDLTRVDVVDRLLDHRSGSREHLLACLPEGNRFAEHECVSARIVAGDQDAGTTFRRRYLPELGLCIIEQIVQSTGVGNEDFHRFGGMTRHD